MKPAVLGECEEEYLAYLDRCARKGSTPMSMTRETSELNLDDLRERNEERKQAFAMWGVRGIVAEGLPVPDMITDIDYLLNTHAANVELIGKLVEALRLTTKINLYGDPANAIARDAVHVALEAVRKAGIE